MPFEPTYAGSPAFPLFVPPLTVNDRRSVSSGLTVREYVATQIMSSLCVDTKKIHASTWAAMNPEERARYAANERAMLADTAVALSDALIKALNDASEEESK